VNNFAFIDESGVLGGPLSEQPFFALGFLKVLDTAEMGEQLITRHYDYFSVQRSARRQLHANLAQAPRILSADELSLLFSSTRHHEYKFTDINYGTLDPYKRFLNTAMTHPIHFCALVIDKTDPLFNSRIHNNYWDAYIGYAKLLCRFNCPENERLCVIADYMTKPTASGRFFEREINTLPSVLNTLRAHSETFMFLQLCDLLLGSVVFQWRQKLGAVSDSRNARAKNEFVQHLIGKFTVPAKYATQYPLAQKLTLNQPGYFNVWPLKLS
jgi:hypothetical protein